MGTSSVCVAFRRGFLCAACVDLRYYGSLQTVSENRLLRCPTLLWSSRVRRRPWFTLFPPHRVSTLSRLLPLFVDLSDLILGPDRRERSPNHESNIRQDVLNRGWSGTGSPCGSPSVLLRHSRFNYEISICKIEIPG